MVVSSANKHKNSIGPRTKPWGTPDVTGTVLDFSFSRTTVCVWSERNACIHFKVGSLITYWCSFSRRVWWLTLSNALEKSSKTRSVWLPAKEFLVRSSTRDTSWVSHKRLLLKPCCKSYSRLWCAMWETTFVLTICSSTLHRMLVKEIGLYLEARLVSPFLKRGQKYAVIGHSTSIK